MSANETSNSLIQGRGQAARRTADAMLRALGGHPVTLRFADASTGDTGSQLGITPPTSADVVISPAVINEMAPAVDGTRRIEITVSAKAVQPIADSYGVVDIPTWLASAQGVVCGDKLLKVENVLINYFAGAEYLYHIMATE